MAKCNELTFLPFKGLTRLSVNYRQRRNNNNNKQRSIQRSAYQPLGKSWQSQSAYFVLEVPLLATVETKIA